MKKIFISNILESVQLQQQVELFGWVKHIRNHNSILFLDLVDSTGKIQVTVSKSRLKKHFEKVKDVRPGSAVRVTGHKHNFNNKGRKNIEIVAETVGVLGDYNLKITPHPRSKFHVFDEKYTDLVLKNRSLYLCNPKQAAVLSFKSKFVFELHKYFQENKFTFIEPPILTEMLLYDDKTAFHFDYEGNKVWLSQCCTFQLEAAILAFEKVYSITPSFRSEHSRSDRHLNEYTHLKVEVAWSNLNDLSELAENILYSMAIRMNEVGKKELKILGASLHPDDYKPPYPSITYDEAVRILNKKGHFAYGKSLGRSRLTELTKSFDNKHLWIKFIPRSAEAFPFSINPANKNLVLAADLIAPYDFAEIGGVAEKIHSKDELLERMAEKGRSSSKNIERYKSYIELRDAGLPPHGGIGMGIDRIARYLMKLPHVKDVLPFPRLFGRRWNP
ncbi:hypothetical protein A3A46_04365 [Candidatus Roizmanbacteria bacterium RIFCSPLOWO2_01_FULL_37_13]|uniref:Aminoacyl-transfer RNA synthetases class-II family profile domain-containing protein n=1 Tax=Candidatus Roizmanbacteria bacterium RIFCSPHIGHO2_02_FULL_38_11 TaxID=1802039 RepID=A0A1F7GYD8_9BACT|nr:MAG: hypothetical protein A3C25_05575 [Candidatus Roizmanbacteria bacterium RIFCSPHIGHO2_02_FULL_38_11]OGK34565.1 MAG: hypothetical protein A3F58_01725 [Candidatus Roizmanbacteria bacterium RIFCSPHIGHO2_12_FULL_37_9b]OGK43011.1 MAG: hypothetical protein A3A46_04365 [Candidatus Roizmanbacteria bacterium RIFCSPLOWO2_01_FULL_37_13]